MTTNQPEELTVAVMGATGTGKSTFVNLASGSHFAVGSGLLSCTPIVQVSDAFTMNGRRMRLIDTPGFDDTTKSDTEILKLIVNYLADSYRNNKKLSGIIYVHRISDPRMTGIAKRNFGMFRSLCGEQTLKNVVIVTNMWGEVSEQVGAARERELASDNILFKPVLDKGATMMRHRNILQSAQEILQHFLNNHPEPLQVQREVVNEGKSVDDTTAGRELEREVREQLEAARQAHEEHCRKVQAEKEAALREQERRYAEEAARVQQAALAEQARQREAHEREVARIAEQRRQEEWRRQEIQRALEAQQAAIRAREEAARRLREEMQRHAQEAAAAQAHLLAQIRAQEEDSSDDGCIIC